MVDYLIKVKQTLSLFTYSYILKTHSITKFSSFFLIFEHPLRNCGNIARPELNL